MAKRSNRMERRDNYEKALREEEEALTASMSRTRAIGADGQAVPQTTIPAKPRPIAPRWARAKREADKKKKPR
jgi:hypothetical protein